MTASKSWSIALLVCCICLLLDRCFVTSFATTAMGYQQRTNERKVSMMSSYSDDVKVLVARAEMILIVPTSTVRTEYIAGLKKVLPKNLMACVVPANKLTLAVDGTAFCQLGELTGSNFCIFVDEDSNTVYEIFCKWVRSLSRAAEDEAEKEAKKTGNEVQEAVKHELIISKRGHLLKIYS